MSDNGADTPDPGSAEPAGSTEPAGSEDPGWIQVLLKVDRGVGLAEQSLLVLLLGTLICIGAYQAIGRNFFNKSPVWTFEALRYSVFFIAMTGAALSAHTKQVIRMDVLTRLLSPKGRAIARIITTVFTIFICFLLAYAGLKLRGALLDEKDYELVRPATGVLAVPIGAMLIAFHLLVQAVVFGATLARGEIPKEEGQAVH